MTELQVCKEFMCNLFNCITGVSIAHIVLGVLMLCLSIAMTVWQFQLNSIGYGIWCGVIVSMFSLTFHYRHYQWSWFFSLAQNIFDRVG